MLILVTGADGFIGSHLTEMLVSNGYRVRALCQYNSFNSWGWLESITCSDAIEVVSGDIRDREFCTHLMAGVDVVFNLAALIAIPYSYKAAQSYIDTNVSGTLNLCQAALTACVKRFIQLSTSEVYGTAKYVPIDEHHPLQPQSPYSASKIASDAVAMSYYYSFELPVVIARPFNTFGPRQSARAVIPTIISQLSNGMTEIKLGDATPTRDFNYVLDTCGGLLSLIKADHVLGEVINIGSGFEISIHDLFYKIVTLMGVTASIQKDDERLRPENSEVFRLVCDNRKLQSLTQYKQHYDLDRGLRKTIDWFSCESNRAKYKFDVYNV